MLRSILLMSLAGVSSMLTGVNIKSIVKLLPALTLSPNSAEQNPSPNIFPIMANDMGWKENTLVVFTSDNCAIRLGDYKLVELYEPGALELYNLKNDVSEANDLAKKCLGNIGKCIICLLFLK